MSSGRWIKQDSRVLFTGGPDDRIHLTVDHAVRPDGVTVAYPHVDAPDFSELTPCVSASPSSGRVVVA